jgi:hypothetical protein
VCGIETLLRGSYNGQELTEAGTALAYPTTPQQILNNPCKRPPATALLVRLNEHYCQACVRLSVPR